MRVAAEREPAGTAWPALPLAEWADTYATLHRWLQIVGKTRLALAPAQNHWWHVALYLTARGVGTSPMPVDGREIEIELDFVDHVLVARTSDGVVRTLPLAARPVADFYEAYRRLLAELRVDVALWPVPVKLGDRLRFDADRAHAYAYPEPPGYASASVEPAGAYYHDALREWILPYDAVRTAGDPAGTLLAFCESTYAAAATLGSWERSALERNGIGEVPPGRRQAPGSNAEGPLGEGSA